MLISCIMPVKAGHEHFIDAAVANWRRRTWPPARECELLILPDTDIPDGEDFETDEAESPEGLTLGAKRNWLIEQAKGRLIAHWDVDDWYSPHRLEAQAKVLRRVNAEVTGLRAAWFYDEREPDAAYHFSDRGPTVNVGASLMYTREWAIANPFPSTGPGSNAGEDLAFVRRAAAQRVYHLSIDDSIMVARSHALNTQPRKYNNPAWKRYDRAALPKAFLKTL